MEGNETVWEREEREARENHAEHVEDRVYIVECKECHRDADAIDWLLAVRKFGLETANKMFEDKR